MKRYVIIGLVALLLCCTRKANAQFCSSCVSLVFDPSVYQATSQTAASVTTPLIAGDYQSDAAFINAVMSATDIGIYTPDPFNTNFPGWVPLPPNAAQVAAATTTTALNTYSGALAAASQIAGNFGADGAYLTNIEQENVSTVSLLQAVQINTEASLANAQEQRKTQVLLIALINTEAVKAGEEVQERAYAGATTQKSLNLGATQ